MESKWQKFIFTAIISVCLVVPFSNDIFISGLPAMSKYFGGANVSLILSIGLLALAIAQPFYGPLLDRFGRRPVLLAGLLIYTLASAQIMLMNAFIPLLMARFFQAIGACSAITSVFAIVRDTHQKETLVKATGLIMAIIGISPTIAPLLGSLLNAVWSWRASFAFLFILGCFYTLLILLFFKETHKEKNMEALIWRNVLANYITLAKSSGFLTFCFLSGCSYGILFSYFNLSAFFLIDQMHFHLISYGLIVAVNALAMIMMAYLTPRFSNKISLQKTLKLSFIVITSGGLMMWLINSYLPTNLYTFMIPMFLTTIGIGMVRPTASAGAMQLAPHKIAGSASAFFNFISFVSGSVATTLTSKVVNHVSGFGIFITIIGTAALLYSLLSMKNCNHLLND